MLVLALFSIQCDVSTDFKKFINHLEKVREEAPQVYRQAISEATFVLYSAAVRLLKKLIYNVKIPRRKRSGKPQWRRTYKLLNAERMSVTTPYRSLDVTGLVFTDPSSPAWRYHRRRHNLEGPREAPWRFKATEEYGARAVKRVETVVKDWRSSISS